MIDLCFSLLFYCVHSHLTCMPFFVVVTTSPSPAQGDDTTLMEEDNSVSPVMSPPVISKFLVFEN